MQRMSRYMIVNAAEKLYHPVKSNRRKDGLIHQVRDKLFFIQAHQTVQESSATSRVADNKYRLFNLYVFIIGKQQVVDQPCNRIKKADRKNSQKIDNADKKS